MRSFEIQFILKRNSLVQFIQICKAAGFARTSTTAFNIIEWSKFLFVTFEMVKVCVASCLPKLPIEVIQIRKVIFKPSSQIDFFTSEREQRVTTKKLLD